MNPFENYAKRALTTVPDRLIGSIKTRAEAKSIYTEIVAELHACHSMIGLQALLDARQPAILQFHAELEFLWHGDGADFLGLEREIEQAFETVEAASFFLRSRGSPVCEAGRSPGQFETGLRT